MHAYENILFATVAAAVALLLASVWRRLDRRSPSRTEPFVPWGGFDVLVAIGSCLVLMLIAGFAFSPWYKHSPGKVGWAENVATAVAFAGTLVIIFALVRYRYGLWARDVGVVFSRWGRDLLLAASLLAAVHAVRVPMGLAFVKLHEMAGKKIEMQELLKAVQSGSTAEMAIIVFLAVALAPVYEEVIFRGFLQPALGRVMNPWGALLIVAAAFSCLHSPTSRFFMVPTLIFPLAVALGYAYRRTGRLAAPLMLHLMNNILAVAVSCAQRSQG